MAFELKDGNGSLFKNSYKEDESDNKPNYTGSVKVRGTEYALAGWKKVSKSGITYISVKVSDKNERKGNDLPF
jgi:uncharacterized protein (DUF736 family)|tara:strand:+ start:914 stop:1132 length:219 start_codon:yes stop_codon:yes gene_type:complete